MIPSSWCVSLLSAWLRRCHQCSAAASAHMFMRASVPNPSAFARTWHHCTVALAVFFSFWVLVYPATFLVGQPGLPGHLPAAPAFVAADPGSISRFARAPLIRLLHCVCGALWTITAPVQLSPRIRKQHPAVHRLCGRLFFCGAAAITAGYVLMELSQDQGVMRDHGVHTTTFYRPLAAWFAYTAVQAVLAATQRDYKIHATYCIRHLGAGLTFALARILVLLVGAALHFTGLLDMAVQENKLTAFYACSYTAAAVSVGGSELVVVLALQAHSKSNRQA